MGWTGTTTKHCGQPLMQSIINLLGTDKMDMTVKTTCGQDMPLSCNGLGSRPNNDINTRLRIGIASLANSANPAIF